MIDGQGNPERDWQLRIRVHPEPSAREMAAIVAAIRNRHRAQVEPDDAADHTRSVSRWGSAGRREAMANREVVDPNDSRRW